MLCSVVAVITLLGMGAFAQQSVTANLQPGCVPIQDGDNLWSYDHNFNIDDLAAKNPTLIPPLNSPSRQFTSKYGQPGILISATKDRVICGVSRQGKNLVPISALTIPSAINLASGSSDSSDSTWAPLSKGMLLAIGLAMLLLAIAITALILRSWLRRRDPAGLPNRRFIENGVPPDQAREYATNNLGPRVFPGRNFEIISQTRRRARGAVISEYLNPSRRETVVLDGGPNSYVYQTRLRFTDGDFEEADMPFLQPCGNLIRYGTVARFIPGLNFEYLGEPEVVPVQAAAAVPAASRNSEKRKTKLTNVELVGVGEPSFTMRRFDGKVEIALTRGSDRQFLVTVPANEVGYDVNSERIVFAGEEAFDELSIPLPARIIAKAAIEQLTAPTEAMEEAGVDMGRIPYRTIDSD